MTIENIFGDLMNKYHLEIKDDNTSLSDRTLEIINGVRHTLRFGSAAGQVNKIHSAVYTLTPSQVLSLDLDADTLLDPFGNTIAFTAIKAIRLNHLAASPSINSVKLAGDWFTDTFGATSSLFAFVGGELSIFQPDSEWAVTASTGDVIEITNNDGANNAEISLQILGI